MVNKANSLRNNPANEGGLATGRAQLEGWIPSLATPDELRLALEKAFDYRGDVRVTLKSGEMIEGYVFDRRSGGASLGECWLRMFPKNSSEKLSIRYSDLVRLEFSGRDAAAGKVFEAWLKKHNERTALSETSTTLESA
jgi:hypothetical protein